MGVVFRDHAQVGHTLHQHFALEVGCHADSVLHDLEPFLRIGESGLENAREWHRGVLATLERLEQVALRQGIAHVIHQLLGGDLLLLDRQVGVHDQRHADD